MPGAAGSPWAEGAASARPAHPAAMPAATQARSAARSPRMATARHGRARGGTLRAGDRTPGAGEGVIDGSGTMGAMPVALGTALALARDLAGPGRLGIAGEHSARGVVAADGARRLL
ncbi:hypothetical protein DCC79_11415 [bacterium]|nr:MAG: hypothetical protein DCC79_11415 [bacterium]